MISLRTTRQLATIVILLFAGLVWSSENKMVSVVSGPSQANADVVLDTRPLSSCTASALTSTVCIPIEDFVAPQKRLANWSGILWLLGTAGLTGTEHVLVVGDNPRRRHVLAGLLAIAGQKTISIVEAPVSTLLENTDNTSRGSPRSTTRISVFTEPMRSDLLMLRNELSAIIHGNVALLDGRNEAEYFGTTIRAHRGGHIPGAMHSPFSEWYKADNSQISNTHLPVSYAHNAIDGLAYFSVLLSAGQVSRLYLDGWADWASEASLPIDSATYPEANYSRASQQQTMSLKNDAVETSQQYAARLNVFSMLIGALMTCCVLTLGYFSVKHVQARRI